MKKILILTVFFLSCKTKPAPVVMIDSVTFETRLHAQDSVISSNNSYIVFNDRIIALDDSIEKNYLLAVKYKKDLKRFAVYYHRFINYNSQKIHLQILQRRIDSIYECNHKRRTQI